MYRTFFLTEPHTNQSGAAAAAPNLLYFLALFARQYFFSLIFGLLRRKYIKILLLTPYPRFCRVTMTPGAGAGRGGATCSKTRKTDPVPGSALICDNLSTRSGEHLFSYAYFIFSRILSISYYQWRRQQRRTQVHHATYRCRRCLKRQCLQPVF